MIGTRSFLQASQNLPEAFTILLGQAADVRGLLSPRFNHNRIPENSGSIVESGHLVPRDFRLVDPESTEAGSCDDDLFLIAANGFAQESTPDQQSR